MPSANVVLYLYKVCCLSPLFGTFFLVLMPSHNELWLTSEETSVLLIIFVYKAHGFYPDVKVLHYCLTAAAAAATPHRPATACFSRTTSNFGSGRSGFLVRHKVLVLRLLRSLGISILTALRFCLLVRHYKGR
ncbi:hypothetical protein EJ05DRAFT_397090 [Pseudovirgaria hyperparasitica]|uniref:Uncharacterized protein n=1 Tax=Pseudovirgaria hyperparasitica TaxID=470096 RepID=A0A6A6W662_9PEZI|nr:uncharacterized protein EJ05DRAFT_397090 [Pseudovirgaria hyperparasitica]KAF2757669.1 hypothetical protein EJ05DRAFT_397090 [Pseudovirgaria hyperparasitica]